MKWVSKMLWFIQQSEFFFSYWFCVLPHQVISSALIWILKFWQAYGVKRINCDIEDLISRNISSNWRKFWACEQHMYDIIYFSELKNHRTAWFPKLFGRTKLLLYLISVEKKCLYILCECMNSHMMFRMWYSLQAHDKWLASVETTSG